MSESDLRALQATWNYLIQNGSLVLKRSYYGALCDVEQSAIVKGTPLSSLNIDWENTTAPVTDIVEEFCGTFSDDKHITLLQGTLAYTDGHTEQWEVDLYDINFYEVVQEIIAYEFT